MKGRTYALLALIALASLAGAWAVQRAQNSLDFRLVLSLKKLPEPVIQAAFGSRRDVADPTEDWQAGAAGDAANPLPKMRFLMGKAFSNGSYELEYEKGGESRQHLKASLRQKDGVWEALVEEIAPKIPAEL